MVSKYTLSTGGSEKTVPSAAESSASLNPSTSYLKIKRKSSVSIFSRVLMSAASFFACTLSFFSTKIL